MKTGWNAHLPLEANGPELSIVWTSLHPLHNKPVTFPALPVPVTHLYTKSRWMIKCLTQGHNMLAVSGLEPTTFCL